MTSEASSASRLGGSAKLAVPAPTRHRGARLGDGVSLRLPHHDRKIGHGDPVALTLSLRASTAA
jgi:hypothetical protein